MKIPSDEEDEDELLDFNYLVKQQISTGSHFILKSEQEKFHSESIVNFSKYFNIDIHLLNASIKSVPFYERHEIKDVEWKREELDCMREAARVNEDAYKTLLKTSIEKAKKKSNPIETTDKLSNKEKDTLRISSSASKNKEEATAVATNNSGTNKESMEKWLDDILDI